MTWFSEGALKVISEIVNAFAWFDLLIFLRELDFFIKKVKKNQLVIAEKEHHAGSLTDQFFLGSKLLGGGRVDENGVALKLFLTLLPYSLTKSACTVEPQLSRLVGTTESSLDNRGSR